MEQKGIYPPGTKIEDIIENLKLGELPLDRRVALVVEEMDRQTDMNALITGLRTDTCAACIVDYCRVILPLIGIKTTAAEIIRLFANVQADLAKNEVKQ